MAVATLQSNYSQESNMENQHLDLPQVKKYDEYGKVIKKET